MTKLLFLHAFVTDSPQTMTSAQDALIWGTKNYLIVPEVTQMGTNYPSIVPKGTLPASVGNKRYPFRAQKAHFGNKTTPKCALQHLSTLHQAQNRLKRALNRHLGHKMHPKRAREPATSKPATANQQIFSRRVFTNSSIEMPAARTWAGTRLIGVMPGTVLVSRKKISPSRTM